MELVGLIIAIVLIILFFNALKGWFNKFNNSSEYRWRALRIIRGWLIGFSVLFIIELILIFSGAFDPINPPDPEYSRINNGATKPFSSILFILILA